MKRLMPGWIGEESEATYRKCQTTIFSQLMTWRKISPTYVQVIGQ
jgi:hypothetical protein